MIDLGEVQRFLADNHPQKADALITKMLRNGAVSEEMRRNLLLLQARAKLMLFRPQEALDALLNADVKEADVRYPPDVLELLGDAFLTRFELAPVGFADLADIELSRKAFSVILSKEPGYKNIGWVFYQLGRISMIQDRVSEAEDFFTRGMASATQGSLAQIYCCERLGYIAYYEKRNSMEALEYLYQALSLCSGLVTDTWLAELHLLISRVQKEVDLASAIESAQKAVNYASRDNNVNRKLQAEALLNLAELLSVEGKSPAQVIDALEKFFKVVKVPVGIDVTFSRAFELLGSSYSATHRYSDAIKAYQSSLASNPYHPWEDAILCSIGHNYYKLNDFEAVVNHFEKAISAQKFAEDSYEAYQAYYLLANAYFALARYSDAVTAYEKLIQISPQGADLREAHRNLTLARQHANQK